MDGRAVDVDTIVALATARGAGAMAVVRLSGPGARDVLRSIAPEGTRTLDVRRARLAVIRDPEDGCEVDRALVTLFEAPASYTGEDVVEISCHGGWLVPDLVVDACVRSGARRAEPGEFTKRAYLHGKLDLVQAEAVADLIAARSRAFHRAALHQLERGLSARISGLRERLLALEAMLAHHVDFPEEDDPPVAIEEIRRQASSLVGALERMLSTAPEGALLREGALAVLAGRPNVGKSSLYNALIGEERAIVTDGAGTTRDALEVGVQLGGFPFRLVDTAGLHDSPEEVERLGIEIARRYAGGAEVLVYCVEAGVGLTEADRAFLTEDRSASVVLVETKADLVADADSGSEAPLGSGICRGPQGEGVAAGDAERQGLAGCVRVSVRTGGGLDRLREVLPEIAYSGLVAAEDDQPVLTRGRHARAVAAARDEVAEFRRALASGIPAEVASAHLRAAEAALEELLGVVSVDDVLDVVFREFCVGK